MRQALKQGRVYGYSSLRQEVGQLKYKSGENTSKAVARIAMRVICGTPPVCAAAGHCSFTEQRFAQKQIKPQGIPCLLLVQVDRIGSIERIFKGFTRFLDWRILLEYGE